jgi:molecular chaperone DnaK (HSP70)
VVNAGGYRLGVDFGTSNTVAMLAWPDGLVRPLLFDGSPALPSAVYADPSAGLMVGRDAVHAARTSPERFEPNPKRRIDEPGILLGETEIGIVDLIAAVLGRVGAEARRVAGGHIGPATVTCPAAWAQTRRGILVAAAERAGFGTVTLVPEPVAAASVFVRLTERTVRPGSSFVVYDLGAGTFDASVVRRTDGGFEVLSTEGLSQSGGLDIDAPPPSGGPTACCGRTCGPRRRCCRGSRRR